jgi:hypothetical protein
MQFRLLYEGELKANGDTRDKQMLRRCFHSQLKELVQCKPFEPFRKLIDANHVRAKIIRVGNFNFVPLITEKLQHVAVLRITLLSKGEPGAVITQGGDLDNRLKTLLDALRAPKETKEIPTGDLPRVDEDPFYCLLEDDKLINGLSVINDRLLRPAANPKDVVLLVHVVPEPTYSTIASVYFVSL